MTWGVGASSPIVDPVWVSAELSGEYLLGSGQAPGRAPIEGLLAVRTNPWSDLVGTLGVGTGFSQGIGAPDLRIVVGLGWVAGHPAGSAPAPSGSDRDGDGIPDAQDLCPDQPEDRNGQADDDGCPDGDLTPTVIKVRAPDGSLVANATLELLSGAETGKWVTADGQLVRSLQPGPYTARVSADGFEPRTESFDVPEASRNEQVLVIEPMAATGTVTVNLTDPDGKPVAGTARVPGTPYRHRDRCRRGGQEHPAGRHPRLRVQRTGLRLDPARPHRGGQRHRVRRRHAAGKPGEAHRAAHRHPRQDLLRARQRDPQAESFPLLDEVLLALLDHPELTQVEVQGHTDDQGSDEYNQTLSEARAQAVVYYLVQAGVDGQRLVARGYGESRPLQPGTSDEARATNRRVEFHILSRDDAAGK